MVTIFEALSWLNQFDRQNLTGQGNQKISELMRMNSSADKLHEAILSAVTCANTSIYPLERAEIFLNCAAVEYRLGLFDDARQHTLKAKYIYEDICDRHRFAVAIWMAGIVERETTEKEDGHTNWRQACETFKRLGDENLHVYDPVLKSYRSEPIKRNWYAEHHRQMVEDLICLPEEIFMWLNKFDRSHLDEVAQQVKQLLLKQLRNRQYTPVYQLIGELQNISKGCEDYLEIPEILVECGLVLYHLGNIEAAIELMDRAGSHYTPHTHHQAVLLWLSGALSWQIPSKNNQAVMHWETAISFFSDLVIKTDYAGKVEACLWYQEKMEMMLGILNKQMALEVAPANYAYF